MGQSRRSSVWKKIDKREIQLVSTHFNVQLILGQVYVEPSRPRTRWSSSNLRISNFAVHQNLYDVTIFIDTLRKDYEISIYLFCCI